MTVSVTDEQDVAVDAEDLGAVARHVLSDRQVPSHMDVSVLLVDRQTVASLNSTYRGEEGPTDVLSFPLDTPGEVPPGIPGVLGDVVICPAVARQQAETAGHSTAEELRMLVVHGILHLLGMDHAEPDEERRMFGLSDRLLAAYHTDGDVP